MKNWDSYHQRVGAVPNSLVTSALRDYVRGRSASLDLGAGNLRDSMFLLKQGFARVIAVDNSEESLAFRQDGIELHIAEIEDFRTEENSIDFAICCNTLYFLDRQSIVKVFRNVFSGLRSGGVFACHVLGKDDVWVGEGRPVSWFTEESMLSLNVDFSLIKTGERRDRYAGTDGEGPRAAALLRHQLSMVLRKP